MKLVKSFLDRGYKLDLVLARAEGPYLEEVPGGCRIVDLKAKRVVNSLPGLVRYLRRERPAAIISGLNHANVIALTGVMLAGVPMKVIVVEHNTLSVEMANPRYFRARLLPFFMRRTYAKAHEVVAVSRGVADDLVSVMPNLKDRIKVIYNPVVDREVLLKARFPVEHAWFQRDAPPVILSAGRLTKQKDYATLLRAFQIVRREMLCRLVILGEGEERQTLEEMAAGLGISGDFWLPGFADNPYQYMSRAGVFVLSSRWEGLPTVLIEAMACGVPLVSTDCPSGPREILLSGQYGSLVPVGDAAGLARAISEALGSPGAKRSREGWKRFEIEAAVKSYERLITGG